MEGDERKRKKGLQLCSISNKLDTLSNVSSQSSLASIKELLLIGGGFRKRVLGLSNTVGAELDWDSKEVKTSSLTDFLTTLDTDQVDESRLNDPLLTLGCVGESQNKKPLNRINGDLS